MNTSEYRVGLVNGRYGYGPTAYLALVDAVGETKAGIIADHLVNTGRFTTLHAKNGVFVGTVEVRQTID